MPKAKKAVKCDDKKPCKGLSRFLNQHGGGLQSRLLYDLKKGKEIGVVYSVRGNSFDSGVILNFCPLCGVEINKAYRQPQAAALNQRRERRA